MLDDDELARLLGDGTPDHAAVSLISASLDAGSSDNVTVVVADLVDDDAVDDAETSAAAVTGPMLVGAAAEAPRRLGLGAGGPTRAGDTGELDAVTESDDDEDDLDPEEMRYAPQPAAPVHLGPPARRPRQCSRSWSRSSRSPGYKWSQNQFYVADDGDEVVIYRGVEADVPGIQMHHVEESSDLTLEDLPTYNARQVRDGISANNLDDARGIVSRLERLALCPEPRPTRAPPRHRKSSPSREAPTGEEQQSTSAKPSPSQSPSASPSADPAVCTEAP